MKSIFSTAIATAFCLTLLSCTYNNNNEAEGNDEINLDAVINSKSKNPDAKGDNDCLYAYREKYDELLSKDDVLNLTGFDREKLEIEYRKNLKDPEYHEYYFRCKNGRIGKIIGSDREYTLPDVVRLGGITEMSLNNFKTSYAVPTDEQVKAAKDVLADVVDGNIEDSEAEAALKKAEKNNISKETIKKTGNKLTGMFAEIAKANTNVDNLGDAAVWNTKTNDLFVLQNGVKFEIKVEVSNDTEHNKEIAIKFAKMIMDKCK